ncbi:MAG TPA: hypothetical protein VFN19_01345 [Candidatus Nanopelagicales bacterium]|nr:hypothetical protein [Candidatus Nanopelagicales bacterium]
MAAVVDAVVDSAADVAGDAVVGAAGGAVVGAAVDGTVDGPVDGIWAGSGQSIVNDPASFTPVDGLDDGLDVAAVGPVPVTVGAPPAALGTPGAAQAAVPAIRETPIAAATSRPTEVGAILGSRRRAPRPDRPGSRASRPNARTASAQPTSSQAISPAVISRIDCTAARGSPTSIVDGSDPMSTSITCAGWGSWVMRTARTPRHISRVSRADHCLGVRSVRLTSFNMG